MNQPTKGPWKIEAVASQKGSMQCKRIDFYAVTSEFAKNKYKTVADLIDNEADALLIASAPEMKHACIYALNAVEGHMAGLEVDWVGETFTIMIKERERRTIMKNIRETRIKLGLTQTDLAVKVGVSLITVRLWEKGISEPKPENLEKLKKVLGV